VCLSATKDFFGYPLGPFAHLCTLSPTLFHTSRPLISVFSCPGLPSRDISLTTSSSHHYDRWMEIVWLRDPNSITALHYQSFANFLRLMDSLFGTVHFLLRVGSFSCSIFIPLRILSLSLYSMMCILVFASLYYLVCSSNKFTFFVLRFFFSRSFFSFVPFIA